jgi:1-phosphofructokinase
MIITLTLNPAVDLTTVVHHLDVGEINRYREPQLDPAGKGINVARMAHRLGWPAIAFGFLAGDIGSLIPKALAAEGIPSQFVYVAGQTRLNVAIIDEAYREATSLRGPGPVVTPEYRRELDGLLRFWLPSGRVLVLAGNLPPGVADDTYARYIELANTAGVKTILDTDGEPLRLGIAARPSCIKPNLAEAERLLGYALPDLKTVVRGAKELARHGIAIVVISMGSDGAVCVHGEQAWRAIPPSVKRKSTVGSGDSLVAGLAVALARDEPVVEGLRLGTAAGAATAATPGTAQGTAAEVEALLPRVRLEDITEEATSTTV